MPDLDKDGRIDRSGVSNMPRNSNVGSLNSWKQISHYLDRGVRTVQRWERDLGLPVHRVGRGPRSPVHAFPAELRAWLLRADRAPGSTSLQDGHAPHPNGADRSPLTDHPSSPELQSLKWRHVEALIAAVEAIRRNAQVRQAVALIAGKDHDLRRKPTDGHHRLQRTIQRGGR